MPEYISLEDGSHLNHLEKDYKLYFQKVNLFYGETGFGKTRLIDEACYLLKDHIPIWFVVSPTNSQNRQYTDKLDTIFIKAEISIAFLEMLFQRQTDVAEVYKQANNLSVLEQLFNRCSDVGTKHTVDKIKKMAARRILGIKRNKSLDPSAKKAHAEAVKETENEYLSSIFKTMIRFHRDSLEGRTDLSPEERTSLKFLDLNPNIGVIFDDCAAEIKKWGKAEVTKKMFYQGRHGFITSFWAFQDDKDILPPLRKNGRNSFFTTQESATSHFETRTNGHPAAVRKKALKCIDSCFKQDLPVEHFRKLVYIKGNSDPFRYTVADRYEDFRLGGQASWEFAKSIPRKSTTEVSRKNPFLNKYVFDEARS